MQRDEPGPSAELQDDIHSDKVQDVQIELT